MLRRAAALAVALTIGQICIAADSETAEQQRGEYLLHAGGCITCHTEESDDAIPLAGGRALTTEFGTFYSPNITPDRETGIGNWAEQDFLDALWDGVNPEGDHYFPSFPYTAYTGIRREDALAIGEYLLSVEPVRRENQEHELPLFMSSRVAAGVWKSRYFESQRFENDDTRSERWNRGAYLVRHLGHCGECHSPRRSFGVIDAGRELAGSTGKGDQDDVPNITPHRGDGIGRWSASDIDYYLDIGMLPDGDFAGGSMVAVIEDSTSQLSRDDRLAIAEYLLSLPAVESAK